MSRDILERFGQQKSAGFVSLRLVIAGQKLVSRLGKCYNSAIIKLDWLKHKRMLWVALAMAFVVSLFFLKNKSEFKNPLSALGRGENKVGLEGGLAYNKEILGNLVNKDTDLDNVPDWEESLWGTNPTKKDTDGNGIPDDIEIEKLKQQQAVNSEQGEQGLPLLKEGEEEELTETDKFSREFFATVAALNQGGAIDQVTIDKLSDSLAEHIQNSPPRKVFLLSLIKVVKDDNAPAVRKYDDTLNNIHEKYPIKGNALDVLRRFVAEENNVGTGILAELDPIIRETKKIIDAVAKMSVPQSLAPLHLDFLNALERSVENLSDIRLYDTDVIVALGAVSQYEKNTLGLGLATSNLVNAIRQKLNN